MRYWWAMLLLCIAALVGMFYVMRWFFRRLHRIEQEYWGSRLPSVWTEFKEFIRLLRQKPWRRQPGK